MTLLPSYKELKRDFPLKASQQAFIENSRQTVREILEGKDSRLLLIVGPCSIHDLLAAKEFAGRLKRLAADVSSHFYLVMRVYCEKPRTSTGWKGLLYDPYLDGSCEMRTGLEWTRRLLLELADEQVAAAAEFLDPLTAFYYEDLIAWGSIGARTSSSQTHRQLASSLSMPIGIKNGVAGNLSAAINGVKAASLSHRYIGLNEDSRPAILQSSGNSGAHVVLRGGEDKPNYDPVSVAHALSRLQKSDLPQRLLIDCSHANSDKCPHKQPNVFQSVLDQIAQGQTGIRGLLMESHLHAGNQSLSQDPSRLTYGVSITDACLDWETTHRLVKEGVDYLASRSSISENPLSCMR